MKESCVLIIGASISGLASAAVLQRLGIKYIIIEKELQVATPWRNHYHRLHLHTNKSISHLPYRKFGKDTPLYPSRLQVIEYLENYSSEFNIHPLFETEALSVNKEGEYWITKTNKGVIQSKYIIVATGPFGKPRPIDFKGMETFSGRMIHSNQYKTGKEFGGQKVLVAGFGNSACEIAIDLYEQGALPAMAVRSPVNMVPRDLLGIPILTISQLMSRLPPKFADALNAPLMRVWFGNIEKLGLRKKREGIFQQIKKEGTVPLLDIGTIKHIKQGHIKIYNGIECISGNEVSFTGGKKEYFDAMIAAIGYNREYEKMINTAKDRFDDLNVSTAKQKHFGKEGLYFCGFWISPRGQIREIGLDAKRIAKDIAKREKNKEKSS